jgi:hypothetical protein
VQTKEREFPEAIAIAVADQVPVPDNLHRTTHVGTTAGGAAGFSFSRACLARDFPCPTIGPPGLMLGPRRAGRSGTTVFLPETSRARRQPLSNDLLAGTAAGRGVGHKYLPARDYARRWKQWLSIEHLIPLTAGHCDKAIGLSGTRGLTQLTIDGMLSSLGLKLLVAIDPEQVQRMRPRWENAGARDP